MTLAGGLIVGAALVAAGVLLAISRRTAGSSLPVQALGTAVIGACGGAVVVQGATIGSGFEGGLGLSAAVGVDPLSGFFLATLALVCVPALVHARGYLAGARHAAAITAMSGVFVLAMAGVVVARSVPGFLAAWELMSAAPAAAILLRSRDESACRTVLLYLSLTHLAGVGVWVSMLWLANAGAITDPSALAGEPAMHRSLLALAALVGFGTKAGLMPLHTWLPRAHPTAPGHVSAIMSGVMIKVALYGLVRMLFEWLQPLPGWVAPVLLAAAVVSCLGGVLYALVQHELKRLLAFHSVENVGIIALGLAAALLAGQHGHEAIAAVAFAAAMLHTLNHALFKSLLFLCAGSFQRQVGELDLDRLGGLLRTMPVTGVAFLAGAMAIAGVPPFNGFASEWMTLQALVQLGIADSPGGVVVQAVLAAVALAATAALAVYCFVKVVGLVLLGPHRQRAAEQATEAPASMVAPVVFLALTCLAIGAAPGLVLEPLGNLSPFGPLPGDVAAVAPRVPGSGAFAPLAVLALVVAATVVLQALRRRGGIAAPSPVWICGQPRSARLAWTSAGFTKSLRLVLDGVLRPRRSVEVVGDATGVASIHHASEVPHLFDEVLYRPALRGALGASRRLRRIQSGSLRAYVTYLLLTLVGVLVVVRIGGE